MSALEQAPATEDGYTVEALARRTGATVRTIRWYQSEGLLPAPRRSGRVALYDDDHVARLEAIRELQGHGLTLVAVRRLLDQAPGSAATAALAFVRSAVSDLGDDAEVVSATEGLARLHAAAGDPAEVVGQSGAGVAVAGGECLGQVGPDRPVGESEEGQEDDESEPEGECGAGSHQGEHHQCPRE